MSARWGRADEPTTGAPDPKGAWGGEEDAPTADRGAPSAERVAAGPADRSAPSAERGAAGPAGVWPGAAGSWTASWYVATPKQGAGVSWVGAILLLLGVALLLHQLDLRLDAWGLVTLVFGLALVMGWATRGSGIALWLGMTLLGYGAARLLVGLDVLVGRGWTTVGIGTGFAVGWLASLARGRARTWPLLLAALFVLVGLAQLTAELPELQGFDAYVGPLIVIALGLLLIGSGLRRRPSRG